VIFIRCTRNILLLLHNWHGYLFCCCVLITLLIHPYTSLLIIESTFAQVKEGLSASSVNPNSTIGERSGNTTADLATGGTSAASVTDGLAMTMSSSSSGKTGNMTNITSNQGGVSASSVNK
jgi:hypothetical protein